MQVFVLIVVFLASVLADDTLHAKWTSYKAAHGKRYDASSEEARLEAFADNSRRIDGHNARYARGEVTYELGLNELSDLSYEEFRATKFGAVVDDEARAQLNATDHVMMPTSGYVDWRDKTVSSVKNQGSCGSCYAFSAAGAIESALMKKNGGRDVDLSEQELVDCTYRSFSNNLNMGCKGGDPAMTIMHGLEKGVSYENDYPYRSGETQSHHQCRTAAKNVGLRNLKLYRVQRGDENALANALAKGPIAVTFSADNSDLFSYRGGIYNNPSCSTNINHAVLLVGFGVQNGQEYWIIKNSWGDTWGERGFLRLAKGHNRCGIVARESYYVY